jgi:hypothetical protein
MRIAAPTAAPTPIPAFAPTGNLFFPSWTGVSVVAGAPEVGDAFGVIEVVAGLVVLAFADVGDAV